MEHLQLLHSMQEHISYEPGHVHSKACTYMHGHTQRPEALMLSLSQDAFIEKTCHRSCLSCPFPT